ncbi:MAG: type II toxin-antitoxin system RelE/ParE family toxin [Bryobacterales bacterium]|nr:type II toxin-antitoxin system RelE/ParE family toxin [Bryobacterales bacterium]
MAIRSFRRGAAERLFHRGDSRGVNPAHVRRLGDILAALDGPEPLRALSLPTYWLHRLQGKRAGEWSVRVSRGWRVTFRVDAEGDVWAVRYENYHH